MKVITSPLPLLLLSLLLLKGGWECVLPPSAFAEGSLEIGNNQHVQSTTELYVDILNDGESISWTGAGTLEVIGLDNNAIVTLHSGQVYSPTETGVFSLRLSSHQSGDWDITVSGGDRRKRSAFFL